MAGKHAMFVGISAVEIFDHLHRAPIGKTVKYRQALAGFWMNEMDAPIRLQHA